MTKTRISAMLMAALVVFFTSCSEKEVPQPVEDTARVDALRQELRDLQIKIAGEQTQNDLLQLQNDQLTVNADSLEALVSKLEEQYNATVSYQVTAVDFSGNAISGATVTLNQNGAIIDGTTGEDGTATFTGGVKSGYLVAVVKADGYATANFTTTLFNAQEGRANTKVALLPKSAEALAKNGSVKISGNVYANFNVADDTTGGHHLLQDCPWCGTYESSDVASFEGTNDATNEAGPNSYAPHRTYDVVSDVKLTFHPYITLDEVPFSTAYFDINTSSTYAGILQKVTYEGAVYEATFDDNGKYTFEIPLYNVDIGGSSIGFDIYANELTHDVTLVNRGDTFSDGAPSVVDPKMTTYSEQRIFRLNTSLFNWQNGSADTDDWSFTTSVDGWNVFYQEGVRE